jgi:LmeA-like phospholipid-binding
MNLTPQRRPMRLLAALVLLGGAALLAAQPAGAQEPGPAPPGQAADSDQTQAITLVLESELVRRLAPADRWEITISASESDRAEGRLPKVDIHGFNLRLPDGQVMAELQVTAEDIRIDLRQSLLASTGKLTVMARFRPEELASFIERKAEGKLRHVRFALRGDQVDVRCSIHAGPLWLPMHCVGAAYVKGNAVYTWATRHTVAGISLPKSVRRRIERKIDPIVDGSTLPIPVRFERVGMAGDLLEVGISLDLSGPPPNLTPDTRGAEGKKRRHKR